MRSFDVSPPVFTQNEIERRQQDLACVIDLIHKAIERGEVPEYDPGSIHISATPDAVRQQGRRGKLIIPHLPYFHPTAIFELRYVEMDRILPFERVYTIERTNDGDLFAMMSDKVNQRTVAMGLSVAALRHVMNEANIIQQVKEAIPFDSSYAVAVEEIETYATLQPATEDDIAALKELLEIATGDVHDDLRTV